MEFSCFRHSFIRSVTFAMVAGGLLSASAIEFGPLDVGGAIRGNYRLGNYPDDNNSGQFDLDTYFIDVDFDYEGWIAKGQYRWYDDYNFLHTGWFGYESDQFGRLEIGLTRVPFGVGAYGPANSWFFDQHYYLGLADKMKLGATYSRTVDRYSFDFGYYPMDTHKGKGDSDESARYSYAVVTEDVCEIPGSYEQQHQFNIRARMDVEEINTTLGSSLQWSILNSKDSRADDSDAYAASLHSESHYGGFGLMLQFTRYEFDVDYALRADGTRPSNDLINMGAYDFAWPTATKGWVPSIALSYTIKPEFEWIDSIKFYNDYSIIIKDGDMGGSDFNNCALNTTGMAIAWKGLYVYVDYAISDGNYFVGDKDDFYGGSYADSEVGDFGANRNDSWKGRFNINVGYYF